MSNRMSTNMPFPSSKESLSVSSKIKPSFTKTNTNTPGVSSAPKNQSAPSAMPKGSPNPGAALTRTNIKSAFGTPRKQK